MAYSGGSERGSAPTLEQVIGEFFLKGAQTVLSARLPHATPSDTKGSGKKRAWNQLNAFRAVQFNLELDEVESANKELEKWRRDAGLPLVVETLLERWVFHHQQLLPDSPSSLSKSALVRLSPSSIYKRLVILLRSVFALLRTLPAHKLCRAGGAGRRSAFSLGYRLHSSLPGGAGEGGPERSGSGGGGSAGGSSSGPAGPGAAQARAPRGLARFAFAPAETPYGRIRVSVDYRPASAVTVLEQTSSGAAPRLIIQDYVRGAVNTRTTFSSLQLA
ncbi:hypothetical protein APUTEX25_004600 [Auxenochlorella protothecoides]|uniref:Autophagy-related protein 13 N-terminal domain-containing protein n=1 Tax=Auxenochlorella protothecoides TaxID=3075 RepID=A0A3M7L3Y5_AUXPR|nr:hypothetical protein APUTEX25_004600 [Auxenochlorella protothecoides]|eukprot:RMZ56176.1 hypothetical protein APUTEX25_004600 [Auxenochlorella protothecoides]